MVVPAVLFLAINAGADTARGWAIPMATDIAFAAGALALFGSKLPKSIKVFLLSLAIVDDIGAIVVIAIIYAGAVKWAPLIAVAVAIALPARQYGERLETWLHPWTSYLIVPLFALANAGVSLSGHALSGALTSRLGLGIVVGLVAGKLAGVSGATLVATRFGMPLPEGAGPRDVAGVAALTGIGFTVSLFIAGLAFTDPASSATATIGILCGSLVASALGAVILRAGRAPASKDS
jgi:NhaA family Na+:H+ antiporter